MDINENMYQFIDEVVSFKNDIKKSLEGSINNNEIEIVRSNCQKTYNLKTFRECFVKKITLHVVFKYILIRMSEDLKKIVNAKFNKEGIIKWSEISKNYRNDYHRLFIIASQDISRTEELGYIFTPCIYDNYIEKLEYSVFNTKENNHIEILKEYDFKTLDPNIAVSLLDKLYPSEDRENLQRFLEESRVINYLMKSLGLI